jgi:hypothetical protein
MFVWILGMARWKKHELDHSTTDERWTRNDPALPGAVGSQNSALIVEGQVFDGIVREETFEPGAKLRGERLIVRNELETSPNPRGEGRRAM